MYYYYSKKEVSIWRWFYDSIEFTIINLILINPLNFNFKRIYKTLSETKLREFNKRN